MSSSTTNMGLTKPAPSDPADIQDLNANMDKLDGHSHHGGTDGLPVKNVQSGSVNARPANATDGQLYVANDAGAPGLHFYAAGSWSQVSATTPMAGALRNLLVNPGFEIWQRGAGPFTTAGAYTADRWMLNIGVPSTASLSRITSTIGSPGYSASISYAHGAGGFLQFIQYVEGPTQFRGRTVNFSARVKCSIANTVWLKVDDGASNTNGARNVGTGEETIVVTHTLNSAAAQLKVYLACVTSCTVEINDTVLVVGSVPVDYVPLAAAEEWARCERYFERFAGGTVNPTIVIQGYCAAAGQSLSHAFHFRQAKPASPSLARNGTWSVLNCGQPVVDGNHLGGFRAYILASATGQLSTNTDSTDDSITAEANP